MALPELIPVRYSEEDAGYVTVRPVVKQTFRLAELADMLVSVAGKDAARIQQLFRTGSVSYNGYRYWWEGFASEITEVVALLAPFPEDDPSRVFDPSCVNLVILESGGGAQRALTEISKEDARRSRLFRSRSAWDILMAAVHETPPRYEKYSHALKADLFRSTLEYETARSLLAALLEAAPRRLRLRWRTLQPPSTLIFVSPRK